MPIMTSQILKIKQKFRYLENEPFFLQIEKIINYTSKDFFMGKNGFVAEVTFNKQQIKPNPENFYNSEDYKFMSRNVHNEKGGGIAL